MLTTRKQLYKVGTNSIIMATYTCNRCGIRATGQSATPSGQFLGRCPDTSSGNHIWMLVGRTIKRILDWF